MSDKHDHIADVRYSVTVPANSSAAVEFAVKQLQLTKVLVEPLFSQAEDASESGIFFSSIFCHETLQLRKMPVMKWLTSLSRKHSLPRIDSMDDLLAVEGLTELWVYLNITPLQLEPFMSIIKEDYPDEQRFVFVAEFPLPSDFPHTAADPTGKQDYLFTYGTFQERIALKNLSQWNKSFAMRGDGFAAHRTRAVI